MLELINGLRKRNALLFYFGLLSLAGMFYAMLRYQQEPIVIVTGINAWLKPVKFFLSVAVLSFTMAWYGHYLDNRKAIRLYSVVLVITMTIELVLISWQAAHGVPSHFNISTLANAVIFQVMGVAILLFTLWTAYITWLFFKQQQFTISDTYLWGIRIGLVFFVLFSFEGGVMAARLSHAVGGPDGTPGIAFFNWSSYVGDLRVAHFFGIHSLQLLPLMGRYFTNTKRQLFIFSALYLVLIVVYLVQAFLGFPAFGA